MTTTALSLDEIYNNLKQVHAMLLLVWGGGINNFDECSPYVRDNFLSACSDGVERSIDLVDKLCSIEKTEKA